jgi:hypothetical protein
LTACFYKELPMKPNACISDSRISRRSYNRDNPNEALDLARLRAAQRAAHRAIDLIDAARESAQAEQRPLVTGPRTGTHPMATRVDPDTRGPQEPATSVPDGGTAFAPEPDQRRVLIAMALATALLAGFILGRAL